MNRIAMLEGYHGITLVNSQENGYGDTTTTTDQLAPIMDDVIEDMNRSLAAALLKVEILSWTADQKHNARQGLTALQGVVDRMSGTRNDVLSGHEDVNAWLQAASTVADGIRQQEQLWGEDTIFKHLSGTISDAFDRIAAPFTKPTNWLLLAGGAVVVLGGLLWLSRPKIIARLSGKTSRRKR
jgi:hypothetical protein